MKYIFVLAFVLFSVGTVYVAPVEAGGPWSDQYCNIKTIKTRTVDEKTGKVISEKTEEQVVCDDGVKDFLHDAGIAKNCKYFTWYIPLGEKMVQQKSIACQRMDGGYEVVPGYHYIK